MRLDQRCPRVGYGRAHVFSNYYQDIGSYAIGMHSRSHVQSASNWFRASNDSVTVGDAGPGSMAGVWQGEDGDYKVSITYYDENTGQAWMGLSVNDRLADSWTGSNTAGITTHRLPQSLHLRKGDQIRIDFYTHRKMRCRIDCIDINR